MAASKTQSDKIVEGDLVMLIEQVNTPGPLHKVGSVYRVKKVDAQSYDYPMHYVTMEPLHGNHTHSHIGARVKRLKKI